MIRLITTTLLLITFQWLLAQEGKDAYKYINSGDIRTEAAELYDNEEPEYGKAIELLEQVNENDTNYYKIQYDIAYLHYLDSNDEAVLKVCDKNLIRPNDKTASFINIKGLALKRLDRSEEAIELYEEYIEVYPQDYLLFNNLGNSYYKSGKHQEAYNYFKKSIQLNPYNTDGYRMLGFLLANSNQLTASSLCYHMALLVKPTASNASNIIYFTEELMMGNFEAEDSIQVQDSSIPEYFHDIDLILKNRIPQNSKYEVKSAFDYKIIRASQAMCELMQDPKNDTTFWNRFLVRNFYDIWKNDIFEGYSYYFFQSLTNTSLKKKIEKRQGAIQKFRTWAYTNIVRNLTIDKREEDDNFTPTKLQFYKNNHLYGRGPMSNDLQYMLAPWEFYHENGKLMSRGGHNEMGKRQGYWEWWHVNGLPNESATFEDGKLVGPFKTYNELGIKTAEYSYNKDSKIDGDVILYFDNGAVSDSMKWEEGERNGPAKKFHQNGNVRYALNYKENDLEGEFLSYYSNGKLYEKGVYEDGELEGESIIYYRNGEVKATGELDEGKRTGLWKFYYDNGQLKEESNYKDGKAIGDIKTFYANGKLKSEKSLDESGKENGEVKNYDEDGILYETYTYNKGVISAIKSLDKQGNVIAEFERKKAVLDFEGYSPIGIRVVKGKFDKEGRTGNWQYFNEIGVMDEDINYKDGEYHGLYQEFYTSGNIYEESYYEEGLADSLFVRYYDNKSIKNIGYFVDGNLTGLYYTFTPTGDTSEIEFYSEDMIHGRNHYYYRGKDGKKVLHRTYVYYNGDLLAIEEYDESGKLFNTAKLENGNGTVKLHYPNGKVWNERTYKNGLLDGKTVYYQGNGITRLTGAFKGGQRHGLYTWYNGEGKVTSTGEYNDGDQVGHWTNYYDNGNLDWSRTYDEKGNLQGRDTSFHDNGKPSRISTRKDGQYQGVSEFYSPDGEKYLERSYYKNEIMSYAYPATDGKMKAEVKLEKGNGQVLGYYTNGKKAFEVTYHNGSFHGEFKTWYSNGKPWKNYNYDNGYINGVRKNYYSNGNLKSEENRVQDEQEGLCKYYYENGTLKREANYWYGSKHGETKLYDQTGKLIKTQIWLDGDLMEEK